jgi:DNA-binding transcriptional LysR family regulator
MATRDIRSLDVGMLRTFDALMREGSVSRAARRLFLTQPAVSASLGRLRDTFGDPLFTRTAHGVLPTLRARQLAPQVERLLADLSLLLEPEGAFDPASSQRIFRIFGGENASHVMLPPLVNELARIGPGIRVFWETSSFLTASERLHKGEFDLALIPRQQPPDDCESEPVYDDHYVFVARIGHPAFEHGVTLDSFCAAPHVFLGYGSSALDEQIDAILRGLERERITRIAMTSLAQIADLLAQSDHVAVMPYRVAHRFGHVLKIMPLPFALPPYRLLACWSKRANADAGVQWIKERLLRFGRTATAPPGVQVEPDLDDPMRPT